MKLQVAVDKLFSHKMFSNKYFLYAVVAASILTNYMRIVDCHYEVVGFFILVGIIMMNFSKNVAVVLTVCLLLTQIIMTGKAMQEGLANMPEDNLKRYMTAEQLKLFEGYKKTYDNATITLVKQNEKLSTSNENIVRTKSEIIALQKVIANNTATNKKAKNDFSNASQKDKAIKKQQLEIATNASKLSDDQLDRLKSNLAKFIDDKSKSEKKIAETIETQKLAKKNMNDILVIARAAKAKVNADKAKAVAAAKAKADAAKAKADAEAKAKVDATKARSAAAKAKSVAALAKAGVTKGKLRLAKKGKSGLKNKAVKAFKKTANDNKKSADAVTANVLNRKYGKKAGPFKARSNFALLGDGDSDMEDENNGIDFLEPSNLTSVTQGTTNLMTKQKDLFSFMNSMTPLIDNAKKMLSGLDLSKSRT